MEEEGEAYEKKEYEGGEGEGEKEGKWKGSGMELEGNIRKWEGKGSGRRRGI